MRLSAGCAGPDGVIENRDPVCTHGHLEAAYCMGQRLELTGIFWVSQPLDIAAPAPHVYDIR